MISDLESGQVLEVLTDYDGALEDIPQWCRRTGNEFIGMNETEDFYKFYIRKTAKRDLTGSPPSKYGKRTNDGWKRRRL